MTFWRDPEPCRRASARHADRRQTLRATLDWSYELLGEPERVILRNVTPCFLMSPLGPFETQKAMPRKGAVLVSCAPGSGHAARVRVTQDVTVFGAVALASVGSQHARYLAREIVVVEQYPAALERPPTDALDVNRNRRPHPAIRRRQHYRHVNGETGLDEKSL